MNYSDNPFFDLMPQASSAASFDGTFGDIAAPYGLPTNDTREIASPSSSIFGAAANTGTDWGAYVRGNPDAYQDWSLRHPDMPIEQYGAYHYAADGSRRDLTPYAMGATAPATAPAAAPAAVEPAASTSAIGTATPAPLPTLTDIIRATPGYDFRFKQGADAINTNAYAKGMANSGKTFKDLAEYGQNFADNYYQQYLQNVTGVAEQGRGAASAIAGAGSDMTAGVTNAMNNSAQAYQNSANSTANLAAQRANANSSMYQGIASGVGKLAGAFGSSYGGSPSASAFSSPTNPFSMLSPSFGAGI